MTHQQPERVAPALAADGRPQAMASRCSTCILTPGGSSLVPPDVVRDLIARHRDVGSVITCHATLPGIPGNHHEELGYAACRGFLDAYPDTIGARVVRPFFADPADPDDTGWHLIDPPREDPT